MIFPIYVTYLGIPEPCHIELWFFLRFFEGVPSTGGSAYREVIKNHMCGSANGIAI
jgi:hypothetical protein